MKISTRVEVVGTVTETASVSSEATEDDPLRNHTADLGNDVYHALALAWDGSEAVEVTVANTTYRLSRIEE